MKSRSVVVLAVLAAVGWGLGVWGLFNSVGTETNASGWQHASTRVAPDTAAPLRVDELIAEGIDTAAVNRIAHHIEVLNAAMTTLVRYHEIFLMSKNAQEKEAAKRAAAAFHETSDRHEQEIESLLTEPQRKLFHSYIIRRERALGLHPDTAWHVHGSAASRQTSRLLEHEDSV